MRKRAESTGPKSDCTLLDLARAVGEVTSDDREIVAVLLYLMARGSLRPRPWPGERSRLVVAG